MQPDYQTTYSAWGKVTTPPYFFSFFVSGQPASANDIQGIMLHKPPKMKLWRGYQIIEEGSILGGLVYRKLLRVMAPEI